VTAGEIEAVGVALFDAIEAGDIGRVRSIYAPDATIWHNYDQQDETVEQNLRTLTFLVARVGNRRYGEIRRIILDDGFVQQHVLRGDAPGGRLDMPAMMRVWVSDGRITRLEEYVDSVQTSVLRRQS
jgi:ketosteroid isomerase-like protein